MVDLNQLYNHRRKENKIKQRELMSFLFEWTYFFYIILPAGILLLFGYIRAWVSDPYWLETFPFSIVHLIFFAVISSNALRTYLKSADQLFLVRNTGLMDKMIVTGYKRLVTYEFLKMIVAVVIFLPYLKYQLSTPELFFYVLMLSLFNLFYTIYLYSSWRKGWLSISLFAIYFFVGIHFEFWLPISMVSFGVTVYLLVKVNYQNKAFSEWLEIEQGKASRGIKWLFRLAMFTMKMNGIEDVKKYFRINNFVQYKFPIKKQFFKKRSQKNILLESFLKWFQRQLSYWSYFFEVLSVNTLVFLVHHTWLIIIVSMVCYFSMVSILNHLWKRFLAHSFMKMYKWKDLSIRHAQKIIHTILIMLYGLYFILATIIMQVL